METMAKCWRQLYSTSQYLNKTQRDFRANMKRFRLEPLRDAIAGSSMLGFGYIFKQEQRAVVRIFWIFVVTSLIILGFSWSCNLYNNWQDSMVITTIKNTALPIRHIEFPAFTICAPGIIDQVFNTAFIKLFYDFMNHTGKKFDYNPFITQELLYVKENITSLRDGETALIKVCKWRGVEMPCSAMFKMFPTDLGMCCSFNMEAADEEFQSGFYSNVILKLQEESSTRAFKKPLTGSSQDFSKSQVGRTRGLYLMLDAHSDRLSSGSVPYDFQGFQGLVHERGAFPWVGQLGFQILPGSNNLISISATQVVSDQEIRRLPREKRHCRFEDETEDLEFHKKYSESNCFLECVLNHTRNKFFAESGNLTTCTPWFLPTASNRSDEYCDPWQAEDYVRIMHKYPIPCHHCLPDCQKTIYHSSMSTVPFRRCDDSNFGISSMCTLNLSAPGPHIWGQQLLDEFNGQLANVVSNLRHIRGRATTFSKLNVTYDAFERDIAVVEIFFADATVRQFETSPRSTWVSFFSDVGGILGLCIGFSVFTIIEMAWILIAAFFPKTL